MRNIKITDNIGEMIEIGRSLYEEHAATYSQWGGCIIETINRNFPQLSEEERKDVLYRSTYDYWLYGSRIDEWFLYRFFEKTHEQKQEYITCRTKFLYVNYLNKVEDKHILDNKYEAYQLLKPYYRRDIIQIESESDYDIFEDFINRHSEFVVKPVDSTYGQGVHKVEINDKTNIKKFFHSLLAENNKSRHDRLTDTHSIVIEEIIKQESTLEAIHPGSVNSVRCNTLLVDGEVTVFAPFLKVGVKDQFVTSCHGGSFIAGIEEDTGKIFSNGIVEIFGEREYGYHPDTGVKIPGFQVPKWEELHRFASEIAKKIPSIRFIAWDLALTPDGWSVLEGNFAGEFFGMQMPYYKGTRTKLEKILKWKPKQQYWWESN